MLQRGSRTIFPDWEVYTKTSHRQFLEKNEKDRRSWWEKVLLLMIRAWWHVKLIGLGLTVVIVAWIRLHTSLDLTNESDFDALNPVRERVYISEEPTSDIFRKEFSRKAFKYLDVLENSVQIVELPKDLSKVIAFSCTKIGSKPPLATTQHSLEVRFPRLLKSMSRVKGDQRLHLLLSNGTGEATNQHRPLFYYIESYAYHAIYCTNKKNGKEDWSRRDPYWKKVGEYLMGLPEWRANVGIDFLAPASHPASGPSRHHPLSLSYLSRVTFLRTDFDVAGSSPKDIIVPYFADPYQFPSNATTKPDVEVPAPLEGKMGAPVVKLSRDDEGDEEELERRQRIVNGGKRWLLFFIGGDNPKSGYRQLLGANMQKHFRDTNSSDVFFSLKPVETRYMAAMADAKFCLVVRGDTTSSRRLFSAIRAGCVPVIISDWIQLPFESLIDYSLFTLAFPESVVHRVGDFVSALRAVSAAQYEGMYNALLIAQKMLLFENEADEVNDEEQEQQHKQQQPPPSGLRSGADGSSVSTDIIVATSSISVFNPVTLALIEAVRRREGLCSRWHRPRGAAGAGTGAGAGADGDLTWGGRKGRSRGRGRMWGKGGGEIGAATHSSLTGDGSLSPDASVSTSFSDLCVRLETRLRLVGLALASSH